MIGIARAKICKLRSQSAQFLVNPGQTYWGTVSRSGSRMNRPVLFDQCFEIDSLLLRGVESVLLVLQLRLETAEDLEVARFLCGQFTLVLCFELSDLRFL